MAIFLIVPLVVAGIVALYCAWPMVSLMLIAVTILGDLLTIWSWWMRKRHRQR
jgi:hypothetical protein